MFFRGCFLVTKIFASEFYQTEYLSVIHHQSNFSWLSQIKFLTRHKFVAKTLEGTMKNILILTYVSRIPYTTSTQISNDIS